MAAEMYELGDVEGENVTGEQPPSVSWIAVDWGTTRLRAWGVGDGGRIVGRVESPLGMGALAPDAFENALRVLLDGAGWLAPARTVCAVICGMAGAREGWIDAGYSAVPARPGEGARAIRAPVAGPGLAAWILPGLKQSDPPDVMRGEETQISGLIAARPEFDGWAVLPGTHSKWARVASGRVEKFFTVMTGELFQTLSEHSILRRSVGEGWEEAEFVAGLDAALADAGGLTARLFGLRARALLGGLSPAGARSRLSGELIGAEIAAARPHVGRAPIALIGAKGLSAAYERAFPRAGLIAETFDADALTLAGLTAAWETIRHA